MFVWINVYWWLRFTIQTRDNWTNYSLLKWSFPNIKLRECFPCYVASVRENNSLVLLQLIDWMWQNTFLRKSFSESSLQPDNEKAFDCTSCPPSSSPVQFFSLTPFPAFFCLFSSCAPLLLVVIIALVWAHWHMRMWHRSRRQSCTFSSAGANVSFWVTGAVCLLH